MIHEIEQKTMDAMQILADTNVKISEAKASLLAIQQSETTYLDEREKRTIAKIQQILDESDGLIKQINTNNNEITTLYNTVSSYVAFLVEIQEKLDVLIGEFNNQAELWERKVKGEEERLQEVKKALELQEKGIEKDKKSLEKIKQDLLKQERFINDKYATLQRTQARLKQ